MQVAEGWYYITKMTENILGRKFEDCASIVDYLS